MSSGSNNVKKEWLAAAKIEAAEIEIDLQKLKIQPVMLNYSLRTVILKFEDYWLLSGRR